jgi:hypothetical protein
MEKVRTSGVFSILPSSKEERRKQFASLLADEMFFCLIKVNYRSICIEVRKE